MIEFQTDVPMPQGLGRRGPPTKYPFSTMPVGGFFFVPRKTSTQLTGAARYQGKKDRKFAMRSVVEGGVSGTRVWRME